METNERFLFSDLKFVFQDIDCKSGINHQVCRVAENIKLLAPNNSFIKISLVRKNEYFFVECKISSFSGLFFASAVGKTPEDAMKSLEEKVIKKLNNWKRHREFSYQKEA